MNYMVKRTGKFLENCIKNPKTTAMGIAAITAGIVKMIADPVEFFMNYEAMLAFLMGIGFLLSADQAYRKGDEK